MTAVRYYRQTVRAYRVRAMDCRWAFCSVPSHTRPVPPAEPAEVCCLRGDVDSSTRYRSALCTLRTPGPRLAGKSYSTRSQAPLPARRSPGAAVYTAPSPRRHMARSGPLGWRLQPAGRKLRAARSGRAHTVPSWSRSAGGGRCVGKRCVRSPHLDKWLH